MLKMKKQITDWVSILNIKAILAGLLVVAAFFIGSLWSKVQVLEKGSSSNSPPSQAGIPNQPNQPAANKVDIKDVKIDGEPYIGKKDAPLTLAYWFDFQCPFCKRFETDTMPNLVEKYVNTGKLRIVFKDFQFLGSDSQSAGLAENAVWEVSPENYFKWHQAMYEKQDGENSGWGNTDDIIALTKTIAGIDGAKVEKLLNSKKDEYQKEMDADQAEGSGFGVNGTPGFVIGTQIISGAQPTSVFTQVIDSLLK